MKTIYCISGLGTDANIFNNLKIQDVRLHCLPWINPVQNETIKSYAARMAACITEENPVILGVSFGGLLAIEIARLLPVKKVFVISGFKLSAEVPLSLKIAGLLRLNQVVPIRHYSFLDRLGNYRLGVSTQQEKEMVMAYRKNANLAQLKWSIHQILNWKNTWLPPNLCHIHGDKDKIFPIKKIKPHVVVKGGTHMMVYNRATEISTLILNELTNKGF